MPPVRIHVRTIVAPGKESSRRLLSLAPGPFPRNQPRAPPDSFGQTRSGIGSDQIAWDEWSFLSTRYMTRSRPHATRSLRASTAENALTHEDYRLLAYFRHHIRKFMVFSETAARAAGLTPRQHQALLAIRGTQGRMGPTVGELSQKLLIRHHSAVGLTNRLVKAGYIRRAVSPRDQREVQLRLTPKARRRLAQLSSRHRSELNKIAPILRAILHELNRDSPREEIPHPPPSRRSRPHKASG